MITIFGVSCAIFGILIAYKISFGQRIFLSPIFFLLGFHIVFVQIGAAIFAVNQGALTHIVEYNSLSQSQNQYAFDMALASLFMPLGAIYANFIFRFSPKREISFFQAKPVILTNRRTLKTIIKATLIVCFFIVFSYQFAVYGSFPIIDGLTNIFHGKESSISAMRNYSTYGIGTPGWFLQITRTIIPILVITLFYFNYYSSSSNKVKYVTSIYLPISILLLIMNGERMPFVMFILSWVASYSYMSGKKLNTKIIFITSIMLISFLAIFSVLLGRSTETGFSINSIIIILGDTFHRIFISQSLTGSYIYQLFYSSKDFAGLDIYLQNLLTYLPGRGHSYSVDLFYMIHQRSGSASHSSFAEAYASFSTIGVINVAMGIGYVAQYLTIRIVRGRKDILRVISYGFGTIVFSTITYGSITGLAYNGALAIIAIYLLVYLLTWVNSTVKQSSVSIGDKA